MFHVCGKKIYSNRGKRRKLAKISEVVKRVNRVAGISNVIQMNFFYIITDRRVREIHLAGQCTFRVLFNYPL